MAGPGIKPGDSCITRTGALPTWLSRPISSVHLNVTTTISSTEILKIFKGMLSGKKNYVHNLKIRVDILEASCRAKIEIQFL